MDDKDRIKKLEQENAELKETLEIMSDKKLMKRLEQKSKGKNIPLKEMIKKLSSQKRWLKNGNTNKNKETVETYL